MNIKYLLKLVRYKLFGRMIRERKQAAYMKACAPLSEWEMGLMFANMRFMRSHRW